MMYRKLKMIAGGLPLRAIMKYYTMFLLRIKLDNIYWQTTEETGTQGAKMLE